MSLIDIKNELTTSVIKSTDEGLSSNFDIMSERMVHSTPIDYTKTQVRELRNLPQYYDAHHIFTNTSPTETMSIIMNVLGQINNVYFEYNKYKTKIRVHSQDTSSKLYVTIKIFKGRSENEYMVEIHKNSGPRDSFSALYQSICKSFIL